MTIADPVEFQLRDPSRFVAVAPSARILVGTPALCFILFPLYLDAEIWADTLKEAFAEACEGVGKNFADLRFA
jgi:hypothetical protein